MSDRRLQFEILEGLPAYGERAESYSATGQGKHREGYVIRFHTADGQTWTGNFQRGASSLSSVILHPDNLHLVVLASGQGYIVDPENHHSVKFLHSDYQQILTVNNQLILVTSIDIEILGVSGLHWRSKRISWDGIRQLSIDENTHKISGEAWSPDQWFPFELDLCTKKLKGGSYDRLMP